MTLEQVLALARAIQILVPAGIATTQQIIAFVKTLHTDLSEPELNAILDLLIAGAKRHKAIAERDAAGG